VWSFPWKVRWMAWDLWTQSSGVHMHGGEAETQSAYEVKTQGMCAGVVRRSLHHWQMEAQSNLDIVPWNCPRIIKSEPTTPEL
jgi:hypothetical protein